MAVAPRGVARARTATLPLPRGVPDLAGAAQRALPSRRSVAIGLVLAALGAATYGGVRQTGSFAIQEVEVVGASAPVARQVRAALRPIVGDSLLGLRGGDVARLAGAVPQVASVSYDRAFPDRLVVTVRPERPVALVRRGADAWVVSARGRVLERVARPRSSPLPRIWVPRSTVLRVGDTASIDTAGGAILALRAVAPRTLPVPIQTVVAEPGALTFVLRSGLELRLADISALRLKLAVARQLLQRLPPPAVGGPRYVDLLVPSRPVVGPATGTALSRLGG